MLFLKSDPVKGLAKVHPQQHTKVSLHKRMACKTSAFIPAAPYGMERGYQYGYPS